MSTAAADVDSIPTPMIDYFRKGGKGNAGKLSA
jgi:hypothetical protein